MDLFVGLAGFRGKIERYRFDLLEFAVSTTMPKAKILRMLRERAPKVVFTLRLPPEVLDGGAGAEDLLTRAETAKAALAPRFVLFSSGPRFTPTTRNRARLEALAARFRADGVDVLWEPRGVWANDELAAWARATNVLVVRDLSRDENVTGPVAYTRLLPYGVGTRLTQHALEKLVERLEALDEAYVVVQAEGGMSTRARLREWLGADTSGADADEDDDLGEDFEEEDAEDDEG